MFLRLLRSAFRRRSSPAPQVQRALELRSQGRFAEAEAVLRAAVKEHPHDAVAATNLAVALLERDKPAEAVGLLERAIASDPKCAAAHFNYANVLRVSGRLAEAIEHYGTATISDPEFAAAPEELMHTLLEACEWDGARSIANDLRSKVTRLPAAGWMRFISPLSAVYLGLDRDQCKSVAAYHAALVVPVQATVATPHLPGIRRAGSGSGAGMDAVGGKRPTDRLRIAYFSRDFRDHPVAHLLRSVFSLHDRMRFEVYAFSCGPDDGSVYRRTIEESVDRFVDVAGKSDDEAARTIAESGVDVLIDLMGHTTGNRLGVLARRPAPVQAHYLGYAGTTGAAYIDYFVSDEVVTPLHLKSAFTEEIAYVPDCFMVSDGTDALSAIASTRAEQHLPESAYVFCNFGNPSRISRENFECWMTILQGVPGSVLWLKRPHGVVVENLRREARACGIDPARLVFAERVADKSAHLGRLALADLALDTIGWHNGHSTTADILWAGVPVLTSPGATFASRVASSLVQAAAIGEVVTRDADDYMQSAIRLGNDSLQSRALRKRLLSQRDSAPFFDTARRVRGLETAYEAMFAGKIRGPAGL